MDNFYVIATIVFLVVIVWLLMPSRSSGRYYCEKCGFTTENSLEEAGHDKLENAHKTVKRP